MSPPCPSFFLVLFLLASTSSSFLFQICSATHEDEELAGVVDPKLRFEKPRLWQAYIAFQAWKSTIFSDPFNFTANWNGSAICSYTGVYCAPSRADASLRVVVGIDLNHADIAGYLPPELGLLADLALFHLNSIWTSLGGGSAIPFCKMGWPNHPWLAIGVAGHPLWPRRGG
jgi:hypothetical protein